jgi:hypothetical protein
MQPLNLRTAQITQLADGYQEVDIPLSEYYLSLGFAWHTTIPSSEYVVWIDILEPIGRCLLALTRLTAPI